MDQVLVLVYAAPTPAACAVAVNTNAPPPTTAAATRPPIALFLPLTLRRCVLIVPAFAVHNGDPGVSRRWDAAAR
ncbi:hypothetical protein GCM10010524_44360 [Streptomyces mexicanus]